MNKKSQAITELKYTHEALADCILAQPDASNKDLARIFGKTGVWVSYVRNSGAFQAYLAERKDSIIDPVLSQTLTDQMNTLAKRSVDILMEKLEADQITDSLVLECLKTSTKALGYGVRDAGNVQVNNNFVVAMPTKAKSATEWASNYKGGGLEAGGPTVLETQTKE